MLKEEKLINAVRGTRFGGGHGPAVKHTTGRRRR
jgi:hypothetical protein